MCDSNPLVKRLFISCGTRCGPVVENTITNRLVYMCCTAVLRLLQVEDLDLALRKKDKDASLSKLAVAKSSLDNVISSLL